MEEHKARGRGRVVEFLRRQAQKSEKLYEPRVGEPSNSEAASSRICSQNRNESVHASSSEKFPVQPTEIDVSDSIRQTLLLAEKSPRSNEESVSGSHPGPIIDLNQQSSITEEFDQIVLDDGDDKIVKKGTVGKKIRILTNCVTLLTDPAKVVYEYIIKFSPQVDYVSYRNRLLNEVLGPDKGSKCYDGAGKLYLAKKIVENEKKFSAKHPGDDSEVTITIKLLRKADLKDCAELYNSLLLKCGKQLHLKKLKNKMYDPRAAFPIPQHKLEIWPGFVSSVREFEGGIHLLCNIHHKTLRNDTPYEILATLATHDPANFKNLALKELLGQFVITRYNNSLYRIDDIDWSKSPMTKFKLSSGEEIRFYEYYKKQYNLDIKDLKQPLLVNKQSTDQSDRIICLIPELCHMTGLSDKMRKDMRVMKDIARYTVVTPAQRDYEFRKFLENIRSNKAAQAILQEWGLTISPNPLSLDGRILPAERILFGNNKSYQRDFNDWSHLLKEASVFQSVDINYWIFVFVESQRRVAQELSNALRKVGPGLGIVIQEPKTIFLKDDRIQTYITALRRSIDKNTQIVVCLLPTHREDKYSAIKKLCCTQIPVPTQVVVSSTLSREDRYHKIIISIALQMNNKLGGASWTVSIPFQNTMVCGIDVYHNTVNRDKSVTAFVASINKSHTQWFSRTNIQGINEELLAGIIQSFTRALIVYRENNGSFPDRIVVYRDGLSENQFQTCREFEISQFLDAFRKLSPDYKPKFTFVLVQKRIITRFYEILGTGGDPVNPQTGAIIDYSITSRNYFDFFLVSQSVKAGTATPSHYVVLYDNSDINPDHIQRLTYKFCHVYYNVNSTIRIPAPCQYAHKLAYLIGNHVKCNPDHSLENLLYYL